MAAPNAGKSVDANQPEELVSATQKAWFKIEDYVAMLLAAAILIVASISTLLLRPSDFDAKIAKIDALSAEVKGIVVDSEEGVALKEAKLKELKALEGEVSPPLMKSWLVRPSDWKSNPADAFVKKGTPIYGDLLRGALVLFTIFIVAVLIMGESPVKFAPAFAFVFFLAICSYVLAGQELIKAFNLEYALWALLLGLLISNTIGLPRWLAPAARTELYIKTGLVLLGAEVLFNKLLALGLPGVLISWVVTPIVLITTYLFGQYVLKVPSKSLNMVISADMSVCGVSAAVATATACKAKREELSLAIGLSLIFTVVMIVVQPYIVSVSGMGEVIGGAWLGGTIDSTGAVAAAGELVGETAKDVAATVKMIQNILIGVIAFGVAAYWVSFVEKDPGGKKPSVLEIWKRFPRFTLGFLGVSLVLSFIQAQGTEGRLFVHSLVDGSTKPLREWLFCLAFVAIGLESNFREYKHMLASGKPLILYVVGQAFNLTLSFLMAWFVFTHLYPNAAEMLAK